MLIELKKGGDFSIFFILNRLLSLLRILKLKADVMPEIYSITNILVLLTLQLSVKSF